MTIEAGSAVVYNGLLLTPVHVRLFHRQPIWDGPTYLYTRYVLKVAGIFNPQYTSYTYAAGVVTKTAGQFAAETDNAIRHTLMQPFGVLAYYLAYGATNSRLELVSHDSILYDTDARNGPTPIECDVTAVKGEKTFFVDFTIETHINECSKFVGSTFLSNMLSHRWRQTDELDKNFWTTRTTHGKAIFRSDRLRYDGFEADEFRAWLFPPVLDYFQRSSIRVSPSPDGLELEYWIIDKQQGFNLVSTWVDLGITNIECMYTQGIASRGLINFAADTAFMLGRSFSEALHRVGQDVSRGGGSANPAQAAAAVSSAIGFEAASFAIGKATETAKLIFDAVPKVNKRLTIRVWGNSDSARVNLYNCALRVLLRVITNQDLVLAEASVQLTQDMMGKFIQLEADVRHGPLQSAIAAFSSLSLMKLPLPALTFNDTIVGVTQNEVTDNPLPNGDFAGTRTAPEILTTADLQGSCASPPPNDSPDAYPPDAEYGYPYGAAIGGT